MRKTGERVRGQGLVDATRVAGPSRNSLIGIPKEAAIASGRGAGNSSDSNSISII